ncbi:hypothetical protein HK101_007901, partial [Irineochytrium annulatum]
MQAGFGKLVASSDKKTRDQAVDRLIHWLQEKDDIDDLELLKLWKGLFYCFWMSDKPRVQEHLAEKLASPINDLKAVLGIRYLKAFWTIITLEWHGIDRLRLDKFYMLLRKFHSHTFRMLEKEKWEPGLMKSYKDVLSAGPLSINQPKIPDSLRYHTTEAFLEELASATAPGPMPLGLLEALFHVLSLSTNLVLLNKVVELLKATADQREKTGHEFNRDQIARRVFKVAAHPKTLKKNREMCYELFEFFNSEQPVDVSDIVEALVDVTQANGKKYAKPPAPVEPAAPQVNGTKATKRSADEVKVAPKVFEIKRASKRPAPEEEMPTKGKGKKPRVIAAGEEEAAEDNDKTNKLDVAATLPAVRSKGATTQNGGKVSNGQATASASGTVANLMTRVKVGGTVKTVVEKKLKGGDNKTTVAEKKSVRFGSNQVKTFFKKLPIGKNIGQTCDGAPTSKQCLTNNGRSPLKKERVHQYRRRDKPATARQQFDRITAPRLSLLGPDSPIYKHVVSLQENFRDCLERLWVPEDAGSTGARKSPMSLTMLAAFEVAKTAPTKPEEDLNDDDAFYADIPHHLAAFTLLQHLVELCKYHVSIGAVFEGLIKECIVVKAYYQ